MSAWAELDVDALLRALVTRGVDFVVVGGIAAVLHGSARITQDLDVCYATDAGNLEALGAVLVELDARPAGVADDVPFEPEARMLRKVSLLTLETSKGRLDVMASPDGFPGYDLLRAGAARVDVGGYHVLVAGIDHLIAMKRAAGRPRDLADVAELEAIRARASRTR